jgi:hypothetical protein
MPQGRSAANEKARDDWICQQRTAGLRPLEIIKQLNDVSVARGWRKVCLERVRQICRNCNRPCAQSLADQELAAKHIFQTVHHRLANLNRRLISVHDRLANANQRLIRAGQRMAAVKQWLVDISHRLDSATQEMASASGIQHARAA